MTDTVAGKPPRQSRQGSRRTGLAVIAPLIAAAALVLLAAGCGGGSPARTGGSPDAGAAANTRIALAYAGCMRSHGVPKYPDATSSDALPNGLPKVSPQELRVSASVYQAAQRACAHLLPNGGRMTQTQSQRDLQAMRNFARCMRSHGVPTWPDPSSGPDGWGFNLVHVHGFDPNSQQVDNKMTECAHQLPPGIGVPLARPGRPG